MPNYFKLAESSGAIRPNEVEKFLDNLASEAGAQYDKNLGISERLFFEQQAGARIGAYIQFKTEVTYPVYRDEVILYNEEQRSRNMKNGLSSGSFLKEVTPKEKYMTNIQRDVIAQVESYKNSERFTKAFESGIAMRATLLSQQPQKRGNEIGRNPFLEMQNQINPIGKLLKMGFAVSYAFGAASLRTVKDLKESIQGLRNHYAASREQIVATAAKLASSTVQDQVQAMKQDFKRPSINASKKSEHWESLAVTSPTGNTSKGLKM